MNFVFISQLFTYFSLNGAVWISFVMTILFPTIMALHRSANTKLSYWIHRITILWFGVIAIAFPLTLLLEVVVRVGNLVIPYGEILLGLVIALSSIAIYSGSSLHVDKFSVTSNKLKKSYRVVHLTDTHIQGAYAKQQFEKNYSKAISLQPDIIVITGDLFDEPKPVNKNSLEIVDGKIPTFFVLGNHDRYVGEQLVENFVKQSKINLLRSESKIFKELQIIGIDDADKKTQVQEELPKIKFQNKFNILLYHRPDGVDFASENNIDLMLCGHTHGGQIIPGNFLVRMRHKYVRGKHWIKNMLLYVHTGTGVWGPNMRLGSRNKITVITLEPQK